jgi:uncharacterized repeat protein (TIGR03803 family)
MGTTEQGGANGFGTIFKVDTTGTEIVLHSFDRADGCQPGGLVQDTSGNLYGTTPACGAFLYGTVFKLDTTGTFTVLHSFTGGPSDGGYPTYESLLVDSRGNLYGVTSGGGNYNNNGTVFKLDTSGTLTLLHSFAGGTQDGCFPYGKLARDSKGNFFGTTHDCGSSGKGVVWGLSPTGLLAVLHNFTGPDGAYPYGGLARDSAGNLYGTTSRGGFNFDYGTVFKVDTTGVETVLHTFTGVDGASPLGELLRDKAGNLYGTTASDSGPGYGTVFKLRSNGTLKVLHNFTGADGKASHATLIFVPTGGLYGTSVQGGSSGFGTVWKLTP